MQNHDSGKLGSFAAAVLVASAVPENSPSGLEAAIGLTWPDAILAVVCGACASTCMYFYLRRLAKRSAAAQRIFLRLRRMIGSASGAIAPTDLVDSDDRAIETADGMDDPISKPGNAEGLRRAVQRQ